MILLYILLLFFLISSTNGTYLYFEQDTYEISLLESTPVYTQISLIKAISSPLSVIYYELHGDTNRTFYLNSITGQLILLNPIDYETIPLYKLTIEARSSFTSCFSELIIKILNINDNSPEINLIVYPSILYKSDIIKYDLNSSSTPFATIYLKDIDESSEDLTLTINDTQYFQIQLIRQIKNNYIYILSTKNNSLLINNDYYYLLINTCDNDQPILCTNQTYKFHMKSNDYLCNLSFEQKNYIIDINENLPNHTLLMHKITNKFCQNIIYTIDDKENFYIDSFTGDLFTSKNLNRFEQSIYIVHLLINNDFKVKIIVRILDQYGNIPFLMQKNLVTSQKKFSSVHLFNSTQCRSQLIIEAYFQLLSNCTIIPIIKPPRGQYVFNVELKQRINYQDTFLLEVKDDQEDVEESQISFKQSKWIIISLILGILSIVGLIIGAITIIIKQKRYRLHRLCRNSHRVSSSLSIEDDHNYNRYDIVSTISKLQVHDDHDLSSSPTSTAVYLVEKPSPPLSSLSPARDDEGYSGSSDVSENHIPIEPTIISANQLLEQYRIHHFPNNQSISTLYDIPRRYINKIPPQNISLV